ncbi:hypothetical protein M0R88_03175 [Halorussus gelatinilyticus]|uniref:DUF7124 domain-containing protein n=1 Tax=Halorussus gelatinilyticus TaxID=2937524 RepID=A0A8U0IKF9_9EURY|nr:hypothetical protein [Halorussus gelatinilyticus]UPW01111.1 hypothetical protein M0R88_03175 [Halorussus gelatinilyticus]
MNGSGEMTLAFELSALERLAEPGAVFDDARRWSKYVGVVSDKPTYVVTNFTRKNRIRQDFFSGPKGKGESLESVREQFETDRHVFVGTSDEDRDLAEDHEWEFLDVTEAAEAAEWQLAEEAEEADDDPEEDQRDDWP